MHVSKHTGGGKMNFVRVNDYRLGNETYKGRYRGYNCTLSMFMRQWHFKIEKYTKDSYYFSESQETFNTFDACVDACTNYIDGREDG